MESVNSGVNGVLKPAHHKSTYNSISEGIHTGCPQRSISDAWLLHYE